MPVDEGIKEEEYLVLRWGYSRQPDSSVHQTYFTSEIRRERHRISSAQQRTAKNSLVKREGVSISALSIGDRRLPQSFWEKVEPQENGCWQWTAALYKGYGWWHPSSKKAPLYAHRVAYERLVESIPGKQLLHQCRNKACINPDHMAVAGKGSKPKRDTCKRGHPLDEANTYVYQSPNGNSRHACKKCQQLRDIKRKRHTTSEAINT